MSAPMRGTRTPFREPGTDRQRKPSNPRNHAPGTPGRPGRTIEVAPEFSYTHFLSRGAGVEGRRGARKRLIAAELPGRV